MTSPERTRRLTTGELKKALGGLPYVLDAREFDAAQKRMGVKCLFDRLDEAGNLLGHIAAWVDVLPFGGQLNSERPIAPAIEFMDGAMKHWPMPVVNLSLKTADLEQNIQAFSNAVAAYCTNLKIGLRTSEWSTTKHFVSTEKGDGQVPEAAATWKPAWLEYASKKFDAKSVVFMISTLEFAKNTQPMPIFWISMKIRRDPASREKRPSKWIWVWIPDKLHPRQLNRWIGQGVIQATAQLVGEFLESGTMADLRFRDQIPADRFFAEFEPIIVLNAPNSADLPEMIAQVKLRLEIVDPDFQD